MTDASDPTNLIDRAVLDRFLEGLVPAYENVVIRLIAGGASNLTFLLNLDGTRYVLRRRPLGHVAPRAHDMQREFTILKALENTGVPVPRVIAFYGEDDLVGAPCYLMHYASGIVLHGQAEAEALDAEQARAASIGLVETLAKLHAVDVDAVGLTDFGKPEGFVERRINGWLKQWAGIPRRDIPEVERIGAELLSNVPAQVDSTLIHGDYRLGNVIMLLEPEVSIHAIVDWELSTLGDPMTDLAHLIAYWESTIGIVSHPAQLISQRPGFLKGAELAERYSAITGRSIEHLPFYLAFENWRAAIIKEGIYQRGLENEPHPSPEIIFTGEAVGLHLQEAAAIITSVGAQQ
ncbi:MAG: acyl-CoA dehydrogenase [Microbacteriaceae bacterium]|nr:acyl-CoA dehydrogenase [Microbacteriaceae bacterium]